MSDLAAFLAGRRPDHVVIVLADELLAEPEALEEYAEPVANGLALVLPGHRGRSVFRRATGHDPMAFARDASDRESPIARDLSGGDCPEAPGADANDDVDDAGVPAAGDGDGEGNGGAPGDVGDPDGDVEAGDRGAHYPTVVFSFAEARNEDIGGLYARGDVVHAYAQCACGARYADRWVAGEV